MTTRRSRSKPVSKPVNGTVQPTPLPEEAPQQSAVAVDQTPQGAAGHAEPHRTFFWLTSCTVFTGLAGGVALPRQVNTLLETPSAQISKQALAQIQHLAVGTIKKKFDIGDDKIREVIINTINPLGFMTPTEFDQRVAETQPEG